MSEENTQNISGADGRSFEERMFARFDALETTVSSGFQELDARLQKLEARSYDTKPIWEQALKEIADMRIELVEMKRELADTKRQLSRRLDRIELVIVETRSGLHDIEDRVDGIEGRVEKLEAKPTQ
jgi:chromosome segregation ATPase